MLGVNVRFWVKRRHCGSLNGGYVADMVTPTKHDGDTLTKADQTPSEDVGRIAQEAGVKTLALSHLTPAIDSISDDTWREPVAKLFKGEIIVGKDLMVV